jgi:hypothetical protein
MLHAYSYTICLVFCYTSWCFNAFFRTNLLTRCHSASSLFSAIFVFQKSYIGNILGIGRNKSRTSYYLTKLPEDRRGDGGGATWRPHHRAVRPAPGPCPLVVRPPWPTCDAAPLPIKTPRREKPKDPDQFSRNTSRSAVAVDPRSGGSRRSSRHPTGEGNHHRRSSS